MDKKRIGMLGLFAAAGTLLYALVSSSTVWAGDTKCTGSLGAIHVTNLTVPQDASCTLNGTIVDGNISVQKSATLHASHVQVKHNINAKKAALVYIDGSSFVGGNLEISQSGAADIQSAEIGKNLAFNDNHQSINAANNTVGGNLQLSKNTGGVTINNNLIGGNLQCKDNAPPPTGAENIVSKNIDPQCANLGKHSTPDPTTIPINPSNTPTPTTTPTRPSNTPVTPTQTPVIDRVAPTVRWIAPCQAGERYDLRAGEQVYLEVDATDNSLIGQVTFLRWDAVNRKYLSLFTLQQGPFRVLIDAGSLNPGWNQVFVIASDTAGNKSGYPYIWLYKVSIEGMDNRIFIPFSRK